MGISFSALLDNCLLLPPHDLQTGERARLALGLQPVGGVPLASPGALMDRTHGLTLQQQQDMQAQQLMQVRGAMASS
jgi:hypothetical protein